MSSFGYETATILIWPIRIRVSISPFVTVRMSRYWARGKFGEYERGVRVALGAAESNSSFLNVLQTSRVLNISTYAIEFD